MTVGKFACATWDISTSFHQLMCCCKCLLRRDFKHVRRLKGHTSYVTHLDWSADSTLIQSNCGAYEILYWDVAKGNRRHTESAAWRRKSNSTYFACDAGRQLLSSTDQVEADTNWHTNTCVLGFPVMGIWSRDADGTDINALQALPSRNLVVTADDFGGVNLLTYPCVVKHAPRRRYVRCVGGCTVNHGVTDFVSHRAQVWRPQQSRDERASAAVRSVLGCERGWQRSVRSTLADRASQRAELQRFRRRHERHHMVVLAQLRFSVLFNRFFMFFTKSTHRLYRFTQPLTCKVATSTTPQQPNTQNREMSLEELTSWLDGHRRSIDAIQSRYSTPAGETAAQNCGPWLGDEQLKAAASNVRLVSRNRCNGRRFEWKKAQI